VCDEMVTTGQRMTSATRMLRRLLPLKDLHP
jgi:hypothetical protein